MYQMANWRVPPPLEAVPIRYTDSCTIVYIVCVNGTVKYRGITRV